MTQDTCDGGHLLETGGFTTKVLQVEVFWVVNAVFIFSHQVRWPGVQSLTVRYTSIWDIINQAQPINLPPSSSTINQATMVRHAAYSWQWVNLALMVVMHVKLAAKVAAVKKYVLPWIHGRNCMGGWSCTSVTIYVYCQGHKIRLNPYNEVPLYCNIILKYTDAFPSPWFSFYIPCLEKSNFLPHQQHFSSAPSAYLYCQVGNEKP
jgi:hypothetical protein